LAAILKTIRLIYLSSGLIDRHARLSILCNKTANIMKQNWNQFLLLVKATTLKQQISKFYTQILSTEAGFCIYDMPITNVNVIASISALNLWIKF